MHDSTDETIRKQNTLSEEEYHRLLASRRRRLTLDVLSGRLDPVDVEDLATAIAARENGRDGADDETVREVALSLHHVHLPAMASANTIEYDSEDGRVVSQTHRLDYEFRIE
ncbi:DUF7344 domain-containing protein [Natronobacterium texcoconense]|uniref:DUF7344 domain-containing protein n=1 Tax=Natronobacterium texcoconense TaxID=1095778 RepID=A0A1H1FNX6_NATTX|nr:hypothetical protein [Natronobacterium texcoconense]SDR02617.1 hypothetical protein SAMN04489842_2048 [Natronobacterium texcoconense]